ncbi:UNVERIFIED_CONTAM: hypothetical protein FKN15_000428 [Acipenser sinensis]
MRYNIFLLLEVGTFTALVELLNMEIDNSAACSSAVRKPAISLADSTDLRVLLNIMYLMVETIQREDEADRPEWRASRETFRTELGSPVYNNEPISVMLFGMVTKFCSGHAPHFPMKKVLLLLWKSVVVRVIRWESSQHVLCPRIAHRVHALYRLTWNGIENLSVIGCFFFLRSLWCHLVAGVGNAQAC